MDWTGPDWTISDRIGQLWNRPVDRTGLDRIRLDQTRSGWIRISIDWTGPGQKDWTGSDQGWNGLDCTAHTQLSFNCQPQRCPGGMDGARERERERERDADRET
ncbi:unnamed protein product [Gadus morhua 'NCC']